MISRLLSPLLSTLRSKTIRTCAETLFSKEFVSEDMVNNITSLVSRAPTGHQVMLTLLFMGAEFSPLVFGPLKKPLSLLSDEERVSIFSKLAYSDNYYVRMGFISLRTVLTIGLFSSGAVNKKLGIEVNANPFGLGNEKTN